jgi:transcriptional regulator with XRE-family HTH domain
MSTCPSMALTTCIARTLSAHIRELRLQAQLSQSQLAGRIGSHRPVISRIERGLHVPGLCTLSAIAHALELDVCTLLTGLNWPEIDAIATAGLLTEAA